MSAIRNRTNRTLFRLPAWAGRRVWAVLVSYPLTVGQRRLFSLAVYTSRMHEILPQTQGDFVAIECTEKLTGLDFDIITPLLVSQIEEYHKIALFVEMKDFHGLASGGLWADTKFDLKHHGDFTRIAIVGDQKWEEWMAVLSKPFTSAKVRYYEASQRDIAMNWASGGRF